MPASEDRSGHTPRASSGGPRGPVRGSQAWAWALLLLFTLFAPRVATASRPVITPGREDEILALLQPHALGEELAPDWTLHSFSIDVATITLWVAGPDERFAQVDLQHPDYAGEGARELPSFGLVVVAEPPGSEAAVAELVATIEGNDDGSFWKREPVYAEDGPSHRWLDGTPRWLREWLSDGLLLLALFTGVLLTLVVHKLRGSEAWMKWALVGIVVAGAVLRLTLSPRVVLAPWPYTRFLVSSKAIYHGPSLALVHPGPVWMTDLILDTTLVFAILAPLAVYVHARYLLDDRRAALIVAGVLAFLPLHMRFSHSDAAFIPSITVSSTLFTLIHVATREPSKWLGWVAVGLVGFVVAVVYMVRPLNIMYFPLLLATAFVHHGVYTVKPPPNKLRVGVAFTIVVLVTAFGGIPWLLAEFGEQVSEGLSLDTLLGALEVVFSPKKNALLNPVFTPPLLTVLAVVGAVDLWRRGKRPLFWFLTLWLFGFLGAHAYVIPASPYMQARYHLHLVVPFMLLVACGIEAALRELADRRATARWLAGRRYPAALAGMVAYVLVSPLIHLHGIRNVEFNDAREFQFVYSLRDQIPANCTVLEYTGRGADSRFGRIGAYIEDQAPRARWISVNIPAPTDGEPALSAEIRELLADPPECLYWYEGLPCYGNKQIEEAKASACDAIEGWLALEEVAHTEFDSVPYDENLAAGLGERTRIPLTVFRAYRRSD